MLDGGTAAPTGSGEEGGCDWIFIWSSKGLGFGLGGRPLLLGVADCSLEVCTSRDEKHIECNVRVVVGWDSTFSTEFWGSSDS